MQNGLNVEVDLYEALKKLKPNEEPRIISTAVWIGTELRGNNVEHNGFVSVHQCLHTHICNGLVHQDRVSLGVHRPSTTATTNTPEEAAILADFERILAAGGSQTTVVAEIQRIKYSKNFWNACLGITAALTRFPLTAIFRPPHLEPGAPPSPSPPTLSPNEIPSASPSIAEYSIPAIRAAMEEVYALGTVLFPASDGVPGLDPAVVENTLRNTARLHADPSASHRASTLVDVENGRPTEVEVILGELVRMGRTKGVAMPVGALLSCRCTKADLNLFFQRIEMMYALLLIIQNQLLKRSDADKPSL